MKSINQIFTISNKDKELLKEEYIKALKDTNLKKYLSTLDISEDLIIKYLYKLENASKEYHNCNSCKDLSTCKNEMSGHRFTTIKREKGLDFSYEACDYLIENNNKNKYLENVTYFETPKSFREATLHNIYTDDKNRVEIIKYFKKFMDEYPSKGLKGVYLSGSFGSGKSYLISALLNEFASKNVKSVIIYYPEFLRELKDSFKTDYSEKLNTVKKAPLLLIDDIGAENMTSWSRDEVLGPILQYRMDSELPTFFTSNFNLNELDVHLSNGGTEKIKSRRIIERIKEVSVEMELKSKNRREF